MEGSSVMDERMRFVIRSQEGENMAFHENGSDRSGNQGKGRMAYVQAFLPRVASRARGTSSRSARVDAHFSQHNRPLRDATIWNAPATEAISNGIPHKFKIRHSRIQV